MYRTVCVLLLGLFLGSQTSPAAVSSSWHLLQPLPTTVSLNTVAYGNGRFVAGSGNGSILVSDDGVNWSIRSIATPILRVVYGNGVFVAAGGGFLSSADGTNWTQSSAQAPLVQFLTFANGRFVAGSSLVTGLLTSLDGLQWTTNSTGGLVFKSVLYGNGVYVGATFSGGIYSSTNLTQWTFRTLASLNASYSWVFDGVRFVAAAKGSFLVTSTNGIDWTATPNGAGVLNLMVFGDGQFFALNQSGVRYGSSDGSAWANAGPTGLEIRDCVYGNGQWVAVGIYGAIQTASSPGGPWVERASATRQRLAGIAYGNGLFAAIGEQGDIVSSSYGSNWTLRVAGSNSILSSITFGGSRFVTVGSSNVWSSSDGVAWTKTALRPELALYAVAYGNGIFVATGVETDPRTFALSSILLTSADGRQWVKRDLPQDTTLGPLIYAAGKFVAFGQDNSYRGPAAVVSTDGIHWSCYPMPAGASVNTFVYGKGIFEGMSGNHASILSTDGIHWFDTDSAPVFGFPSAAYGNGTFVAAAQDFAVSQDGFAWADHQSLPSGFSGIGAIVYEAGKFIAVGDHGMIYEYEPILNSTLAISQQPASQYLPFGHPALVTAGVVGSEPLVLQWYRNGVPMPGQTNTALFFERVEAFDSGFYTLSASNAQGSVISQSAVLTVLQPDPLQNWKQRTWGSIAVDPYTTSLQAIAYGDGKFVAVGSPNLILSSTNGALWKQHVPPVPFHGRDIAFGNGTFVALNTDESGCDSFLASSNGSAWMAGVVIGRDAFSCVSNLNAVAFGANTFVAVGKSDVLVSSNGLIWTVVVTGAPLNLQSVTYGNDMFVAVGVRPSDYQNILLYSPDGVDWSFGEYAVPYPMIGQVQRVAFGNGKFIITSDYGSVLTSEDGMLWTPHIVLEGVNLGPIAFGVDRFVLLAGSYAGPLTVLSSTNGEAWDIKGAAYDGYGGDGLLDIAYGQGTFVAVGWGGFIVQSDPLLNTAPEILQQPASATFLSALGYYGYLSAVVVGSSPLVYEWYKDGAPLCLSRGPSLDLPNVTLSDTGDYQLKVSNPFGSVTSAVAHITIEPRQPLLGIVPGFDAQLSVWARTGIPYVVEAVDSFTNYALGWHSVHLFTAAKIPYIWTDLEANAHPRRFYRIREAWANEPLPPPQSMVPAGLGGHSMSVTVEDGSAPFANVGTYQWVANGALAAASGTYSIFGDGSNIGNGTGTYRYNRIGSNVATLSLQDSNFGTVYSELVFDTPTSGHITTSDTSGGFQVGTFTLH